MEQRETVSSAGSSAGSDQPGLHSHLQQHIDLIVKHEQEFLAQRTHSERIGDRTASLIGSLSFVCANATFVIAWVGWNTVPSHMLPHFDPFPFPFLDLALAFEAILMASFILMRQSRISRRSEEREQLMLQIMLLTEREITAVLGVERQFAARMGLHKLADDEEISQLSEQTSIDDVAQGIRESFPAE